MNGIKEFSNDGKVVLCKKESSMHGGSEHPEYEELSFADRCKHMLILGPPGWGNPSKAVLPLCYQDIHTHERGLTFFSNNEETAKEVAAMAADADRHYLFFNPDLDNCPYFNPLHGDMYDVMESITQVYVFTSRKDSFDNRNLGEIVLRKALLVLKCLDRDRSTDGYYSNFISLSRLLNNLNGQGREMVQKFARIWPTMPFDSYEVRDCEDAASWFLNNYFTENSPIFEQSLHLRLWVDKLIENPVLRKVLNPDIEKGEYNQIDFKAILEYGYVACLTTGPNLSGDIKEILRHLLLTCFQSACSNRILNMPHPRRSFFKPVREEQAPREHSVYICEAADFITPTFGFAFFRGGSATIAFHILTSSISQMYIGMEEKNEQMANGMLPYLQNAVLLHGCAAKEINYLTEIYYGAGGVSPIHESIACQPENAVIYRILKDGTPMPLQCGQLIQLEEINPGV